MREAGKFMPFRGVNSAHKLAATSRAERAGTGACGGKLGVDGLPRASSVSLCKEV